MAAADDLSTILSRPEPGRIDYGQGVLTEWNPVTFQNKVHWQEVPLTNAIIAPGVDALSLQPGDPVLLQILKPPGGGIPTFVVVGHMNVPPLADPVAIRGGTLIVDTSDGIEVRSGGSVNVNDGGSIRARYADGSTAIVYGSLILAATGEPDGHGLLVNDDIAGGQYNIFRARRDENGDKQVFIGASDSNDNDNAKPVDEFTTRSLFTLLDTYVDDSTPISDPQTRISQTTSINLTSLNQINLRTPDSPSVRVDAQATGNSPNAVILSPNGTIAVNTSARRFKTSIEDYRADADAVLQLQPRTWRDKRDVELDPDTEAWHVGLVAEEVDALGLHEYVDYDADGQPQRVTYDRLCVALLQVAQSQEERLAALEAAAGITAPPTPQQATRKPKRRPVDDGPDDGIRDRAGR